MRAEAKYLDEVGEIDVSRIGGECQTNVLLDRAPGQQTGLLEYDAETSGAGGTELTAEVRIESGCDPEDRGLAATGRTDQHAKRSGLEPKFQAANDLNRYAVGRQKALRIDAKLKCRGVSSDLHVVQAVAPKSFRWPA